MSRSRWAETNMTGRGSAQPKDLISLSGRMLPRFPSHTIYGASPVCLRRNRERTTHGGVRGVKPILSLFAKRVIGGDLGTR